MNVIIENTTTSPFEYQSRIKPQIIPNVRKHFIIQLHTHTSLQFV